MRALRPLALFAFLALALAVIWRGNRQVGFFETSEARYAEVAREMTVTGDYISPQINYVYHFTKPPLVYWITAAGYRLLGATPFAARFFLGFAAALVLLLTALLYRMRVPGSTGLVPAAFLFLSLEFFALAKVLTTDMFLCLWVTAGFTLWELREEKRLGPRPFAALLGVTAAAAFLTKGPVGILVWASVLVPYALWKDRGRSLKPFASPFFWGTALLLGVPWFVAVGLKHPGLLAYLITRESVEAAVSAKRFHPGPWYYFIPIFLVGFFPWWALVFARWRQAVRKEVRLWLLWAVVPVVIWSLFPAKLPTYILPTFPAWALLAAWALERGGPPGRGLGVAMGAASAMVAGGALAFLVWNPIQLPTPSRQTLLLFTAASLLGLFALLAALLGRGMAGLAAVAACVLAVELAIPPLCLDLQDILKIESHLGQALAARRAPGEPVLEYSVTLFSIPFYLGDKVAAFDNGFTRNKYLETVPPHILRNRAQLQAFLAKNPKVWVVADQENTQSLHRDIPGLNPVLRRGRHSLWVTTGPGVWGYPTTTPAGEALRRAVRPFTGSRSGTMRHIELPPVNAARITRGRKVQRVE
jgi:4-amino-4-deoxy-L-arabinose transferase